MLYFNNGNSYFLLRLAVWFKRLLCSIYYKCGSLRKDRTGFRQFCNIKKIKQKYNPTRKKYIRYKTILKEEEYAEVYTRKKET